MSSFAEVLADPSKSSSIIEDCVRLIDDEVRNKGGLSGVAIKGGYKLVQNFKPGFVENVLEHMLPEFAAAVDPFRQQAVDSGQSVSAFFVSHSDEVADALLSVTDARAQQSEHGGLKRAYGKLRGAAKKNVVSAVPGLGAIIEKYVD